MIKGECRKHDPELWFSRLQNATGTRKAKLLCKALCPVREECLLGRAVTNDRILSQQPEVEELLRVLEEWAKGLHNPKYSALRWLYSHALDMTTEDVATVSDMIAAVKRELVKEADGPAES